MRTTYDAKDAINQAIKERRASEQDPLLAGGAPGLA